MSPSLASLVPAVGAPGPGWATNIKSILDKLTGLGDLASRPAAGNAGAYYICSWAGTTLTRLYRDTGTEWVNVNAAPGVFDPLDFGADPTGSLDSWQAFVDAIAAAVADMDTGLPYETGKVQGAIVQITAGQYTIDGDINLPQNKRIYFRGEGGQADRTTAAPVIGFSSGGFVIDDGQAHGYIFERLAIVTEDAPAIWANSATITTNFSAVIRDCLLRSRGDGIPALKLSNVFDCNVHNTTLRSLNTATPSVLIESTDTGVGGAFQGWMFRFKECLFETGGIRWDCSGTNSTIPGTNFTVQDCISENFATGSALLHIRNTHATDAFTHYGVEIINFAHYDAAGTADIVKLETLGSGNLTVSPIHIRKTAIGGGSMFVNGVQTGSGGCVTDFVLVEGRQANAGQITWAGPGGGTGAMYHASGSGWTYETSTHATAGTALTTRKAGESQPRFKLDGLGMIRRSVAGAAAPDIVDGIWAGTPEGNVTSGVGGFIVDVTNGIAYVKVTGSGNTGWAPIAGVKNNSTMQNSAGTSFIDWSRVQGRFIGNGSAITWELRQAGSQTVDILNIANNSGTPLSHFNKDGYFMTRKTAAPADGDVATSELAIWFDNTAGAAKVKFKAKDSGGTVRTGEVALA